jgi:hypothetical protein
MLLLYLSMVPIDMHLSDADYIELLRLTSDHWALRLEVCFLEMELALRAGFNPNQPRIPRGNPDGGQWTDGGGSGTGSAQAQPISSRPRGSGTVRIGGRLIRATPAQQMRLVVSNARARAAERQVREIDPNWRPTPSLHETVEGAIAANERIVREAEARLGDLGGGLRRGHISEIVSPGGTLVGVHAKGAGREVRTCTEVEFSTMLEGLSSSGIPHATPHYYPGQFYRRFDGTIFGVRTSRRHGITIDIIHSPDPDIPRNLKVHKK